MKITTLSTEELELKEGGAIGIAVGVFFFIFGLFFAVIQVFPYSLGIALGMWTIGMLFILFSSSIKVIANRRSGQLRYSKKRLVGGQESMYPFTDICGVETRNSWSTVNTSDSDTSSSTPVLRAQSMIVLRDGRRLALCHQRNPGRPGIPKPGSQIALANQVAQFLNVPFQELAP